MWTNVKLFSLNFRREEDKVLDRGGGRIISSADELGKTIGVPYLSNLSGVQPVRTNVSEHSDSKQHFAYIKVFANARNVSSAGSTSTDLESDKKPYSLLEIARDRKLEIERVKIERQTEEYKNVRIISARFQLKIIFQ